MSDLHEISSLTRQFTCLMSYRDFSSSKVLTMEFIGGIKVSEITKVQAPVQNLGIDPKVVAARGADLVLKQIFEHGFFQCLGTSTC